MSDHATTIVVLGKEPVPGRVKTRLHAAFTPQETASLAAACIDDTLAVVRASACHHRILAWQGKPGHETDDFDIVAQPEGDLNQRLAAAFGYALNGATAAPTLLIGMDTPQVTTDLLNVDWEGADAVLGLSDDGGFWAIGLRGGDPSSVFAGIPMSTDRTGAAQLARLTQLGLSVRLLPPLRDIDLPADAEEVAYRFPLLGFSRRLRELEATRFEQPADRLFDRAFLGEATQSSTRDGALVGNPLAMDVSRWSAPADAVDLMAVSRCEAPVIDLGCGPGRMVVALNQSGRSALGVDMSAAAVGVSLDRGGLALRRRITETLPAEGRWGTALLLDTNIGMGGDVATLLQRCRELVAPGGLIICEVDAQHDRHDVREVVLNCDGVQSVPLPWASIGARALERIAAGLDLVMAEEWTAEGRVFVTLRRTT